MKERPILFSGEMVRAILEGRKTMTRRVIKPFVPIIDFCPYGKTSDRLWVRETFAHVSSWSHYNRLAPNSKWLYRADKEWPVSRWKPSIFMPRLASRITLEITGVRVEQVRDISENDASAEGLQDWYPDPQKPNPYPNGGPYTNIQRFAALWDSINKKRGYGWDSNPWVWVIEFKRI